ncbi:aconitate hydratase AcnA [Denitromonas iodatirespirans]|uniref:Aconitate hydratase n=1 Tax=Denitromonas iodatirespirans TaxID=2795389 RepID=A0A944D805_DENI1|nr:aconitate hydratase AcnA [Denitromonas iodatirespirans]MBT0961520.1 aconitate hydratase AcnA [Denitromonas iodatirespirans]
MSDSFNARASFKVGDQDHVYYRLDALRDHCDLGRLPYVTRILLENLLRFEDGESITRDDILAVAANRPAEHQDREIAFTPARVVMQDFTGVPAIVDLAAMRDAMQALGGDPEKINPLAPAELVIDHSVMVDHYGSADSLDLNAKLEYQRNRERYQFLRWGQQAFSNFRVVPPATGIVHQVNLEHLARVVFTVEQDGERLSYPDTLVGTDSHTTMINGLGVLGWGVGGIEAEAAMLGQPITMLIPEVVGFRLSGQLAEGVTATDLVLTVTEILRKQGVVGKFVEFFGPGLAAMPLADRATIANMAPEYGATCGIFPIDDETLRYLRLTGRDDDTVALVEAYAKAQGLFHTADSPEAEYSQRVELDLGDVVPSIAGPKRPQDRIALAEAKTVIGHHLRDLQASREGNPTQQEAIARLQDEGGTTAVGESALQPAGSARVSMKGESFDLSDGAVVIAAITSCTNTSNPSVIMAAGLLARNALARGLKTRPWVKTSLAPGSRVVTDYLERAGLLDDLVGLGFDVVGYGCTTCIGNSGPLPDPIRDAVQDKQLAVASVLSGNRNFEGRVHPEVQLNFLASPPLVVAYALAGRMDVDLTRDPLGDDADGKPVYLKDIWPSLTVVQDAIALIDREMFRKIYADVFKGDARWADMDTPQERRYDWPEDSTYIRNPPYFQDMTQDPPAIAPIEGARVLALLGDSITTDHISPAGAIKPDSPAGDYLHSLGVDTADFNSYGSRRGNHEVMMRGTFANVRLKNQLAPGTEGSWTRFQPDDQKMTIYDAAMRYQSEGTPLIVIAGKEYGTGSSRDWAAKGTLLLGVRAVLAQSYERIHRSNLVGMGVLPLQFMDGESAESLGLTGKESFDIEPFSPGDREVRIHVEGGEAFTARVRIDTPKEWDYYQHGGILHYVLRQLARG